jgi:hypothetical protein
MTYCATHFASAKHHGYAWMADMQGTPQPLLVQPVHTLQQYNGLSGESPQQHRWSASCESFAYNQSFYLHHQVSTAYIFQNSVRLKINA